MDFSKLKPEEPIEVRWRDAGTIDEWTHVEDIWVKVKEKDTPIRSVGMFFGVDKHSFVIAQSRDTFSNGRVVDFLVIPVANVIKVSRLKKV